MTARQRLFELPDPPAAPPAGEDAAGADGPAERQLTLLTGGDRRRPEWWLSPRTRVVGKLGIADARAVLDRSARVRGADDDAAPARRAG
jgi:hypothetical protein